MLAWQVSLDHERGPGDAEMTLLIALLVWVAFGVPNWIMLHNAEQSELAASTGLLLGPLVWIAGLIMWAALAAASRMRAKS
jgi:hypothetical protein